MTSDERHEARYQRRKAKREQRRKDRARAVGGLARVFTYNAMFKAGRKCCNGVRWKNSVQRFEMHLFSQTAKCRRLLFEKKWKPGKYVVFPLNERGKKRIISAPRIQDRQVHKTLNQGALMPLYTPDMINHNGANLPGKGFQFSLNALADELRWHYRHYGREGWIILTDFKKFFPSAPHSAIYQRHERILLNPNIRDLADRFLIPGGIGLPLGVEISQMEMVALPSPVDNFLKCQLHLKGEGHHMDDYAILVPPHGDPNAVLAQFAEKAASIGLKVNLAKTCIQPLTKPFKFCKAKFLLTETGRVVKHGNRDSVYRFRRKMKAFKKKIENKEKTLMDLYTSTQSSLAYFENYDDHNRVLSLRRLFYKLFGFSAEKIENFKEDTQPCNMWFTDDYAVRA